MVGMDMTTEAATEDFKRDCLAREILRQCCYVPARIRKYLDDWQFRRDSSLNPGEYDSYLSDIRQRMRHEFEEAKKRGFNRHTVQPL